ncbi:hypothetical protein KJ992_03600, partial [Patescibacteria group bacterium]|nr:hypothetical protein [Patescibacteria group bacterium]
GSMCYGLIKLCYPDKINSTQFAELKENHKISDDERMKWWPRKEILYSYKFETIKLFEERKASENAN